MDNEYIANCKKCGRLHDGHIVFNEDETCNCGVCGATLKFVRLYEGFPGTCSFYTDEG